MRLSFQYFVPHSFVRMLLALVWLYLGVAYAGGMGSSVKITEAWVRLPPPTAMVGGGFMVIENSSSKEAIIVSAKNPASHTTELHTHIHENGVMKMREVPAIHIPAKGRVELKPGGLHVMLINLIRPLKVGQIIPITFTFADGSSVQIEATVKNNMGDKPLQGGAEHKGH